MWKCPHCESELKKLYFIASTIGWESGSAILSTKEAKTYDRIVDYDYGDSGTDETDNYEYKCPECDEYIDTDDLIWEGEEETEKEVKEPEPEESLHKIIMPKNRIISENLPKDTTQNGIICKNKKCKYVFAYEQNDPYDQKKEEFFECPKCSTVTSKKDYLNTLNKT